MIVEVKAGFVIMNLNVLNLFIDAEFHEDDYIGGGNFGSVYRFPYNNR